jgi:hypothetical protein
LWRTIGAKTGREFAVLWWLDMTPLVQVVLAVVSAGLPTLTVLVSLLINNQRLSDFEKRMDQRFAEQRDLLRSEIFRIEQVLDVRLNHLEHA